MTLKKEVLRVQFGSGVDTKSTDIVLEPGKLEVLENAVFEKTGKIQNAKGLLLRHGMLLRQITQLELLPIEITL